MIFSGQTVKVSGIALQDSEMFSHGELYVALSRCGENKNITILCDPTKKTKNIVYQQALTRIDTNWLWKENHIYLLENDANTNVLSNIM